MSIRTAVRAAVIASWSVLAACSAPALHVPDGQTYLTSTKPYDGDLKAFASQVTIDTVLAHPGATLLSSLPFPGCPAMGGLATYALSKASPAAIMLVGFTVLNGSATTATYTRPKNAPPDPGITTAMHSAICQV
ncbi:MAG TPA: hypothetical protein VIG46_05095 [Candidatus Baltobacteraceae bacterium]|jgi:hypothetical protein